MSRATVVTFGSRRPPHPGQRGLRARPILRNQARSTGSLYWTEFSSRTTPRRLSISSSNTIPHNSNLDRSSIDRQRSLFRSKIGKTPPPPVAAGKIVSCGSLFRGSPAVVRRTAYQSRRSTQEAVTQSDRSGFPGGAQIRCSPFPVGVLLCFSLTITSVSNRPLGRFPVLFRGR